MANKTIGAVLSQKPINLNSSAVHPRAQSPASKQRVLSHQVQFANPARIIHTDAKHKSAKQQSLIQYDEDRGGQEPAAASFGAATGSANKSKSPAKVYQQQMRSRVLSKRSSSKVLSSIEGQAKDEGGSGKQGARLNNNSRASVQNLKLKRNG